MRIWKAPTQDDKWIVEVGESHIEGGWYIRIFNDDSPAQLGEYYHLFEWFEGQNDMFIGSYNFFKDALDAAKNLT